MNEYLGLAVAGVVFALALMIGFGVYAFSKTASKTADAMARQPEVAEEIKGSSRMFSFLIESCVIVGILVAGAALLVIATLNG